MNKFIKIFNKTYLYLKQIKVFISLALINFDKQILEGNNFFQKHEKYLF